MAIDHGNQLHHKSTVFGHRVWLAMPMTGSFSVWLPGHPIVAEEIPSDR
jgi:hypothetical protein